MVRCLYDILGVERSANDDEVKKAYRKMALTWHPGELSEPLPSFGARKLRHQVAYLCLCCGASNFSNRTTGCTGCCDRTICPPPTQMHKLQPYTVVIGECFVPRRHTDKNRHRLEEAESVFKEIQNAYEVLSDKHERAWCVLATPVMAFSTHTTRKRKTHTPLHMCAGCHGK
jgi:hypothetical protein